MGTRVAPRQVNPNRTALVDASVIITDCSLSTRFRVTLSANRVLGNPINPIDGQQYVWEIIQDSNGNRLLTFDTKFGFGTDITSVTLSTGGDLRDFITAIYNETTDKFYIVGVGKGY